MTLYSTVIKKITRTRALNATYECGSISNQPDLFLTDRHSHNKIYVQYLSIIGTLVDNLLRLQAWPVSQIIFW